MDSGQDPPCEGPEKSVDDELTTDRPAGLPKGWTTFLELDKAEPRAEADTSAKDRSGIVVGGRFKIKRKLGSGTFGEVWLARDTVTPSDAALKILKTKTPDLGLLRRFQAECEVLANIKHRNLVTVRDFGVTPDGHPFMALEYVPGRNLGERLENDGPLPWREVIDIAIPLTEALQALHDGGVIHRDVKPDNIVVGKHGVMLIDLGHAKVMEQFDRLRQRSNPIPPRQPTREGWTVGTIGFMPPEAGLIEPNPSFDVYGLGATLFSLLTRRVPECGKASPTIRELVPEADVPPELERILADALAVEPDDRIASAAELGRALAAVREAHPERTPLPLFDGRYERIEVLGTTITANVYRGYHRGSQVNVALKVLSDAGRADPVQQRRLELEARILAALNHPILPRYYDYSPERGYLAMELAPGEVASAYCTTATRLRPFEVASVGIQLARGLAALHDIGVIHRDVRARNVMIDLRRDPVVKLLDLDAVQLTDRFYARVPQRYPTPPEERLPPLPRIERKEWSAPETRAGQPWTERCDVYSLGLLLYRLLTGKVATRDGEPIDPPQDHAPNCSDELGDAILLAVEADPKHRVDMTGLIEHLDLALAMELGGPQEAAPAKPAASPPKRAATNEGARAWSRIARYAAVGGALVLAWSLGQIQGTRSRDEPTISADPAPITEQPARTAAEPSAKSPPPAAQADSEITEAEAARAPQIAASVEEALKAVDEPLRACAARAGRLVPLELRAGAGATRFDTIDIMTADSAVERCFREALEPVRFAPQPSAVNLFPGYQP